jgi:ABC-type nitrate/sulfonate/bicarbonate transport systems, periplasmic components
MGQLLPGAGHEHRQPPVGRRAIVTYSALVVAPDSPVFTPQQLAGRTIGVPFYFGTHYIALHMLEGSCRARRSSSAAHRTAHATGSTR